MFGLFVSSLGLQRRHVDHIRLYNLLLAFLAMNHIKPGEKINEVTQLVIVFPSLHRIVKPGAPAAGGAYLVS